MVHWCQQYHGITIEANMRSIDIWRDKVPSAACVFLISMLQRAMEVSGVHMANSRAERLPSQEYVFASIRSGRASRSIP